MKNRNATTWLALLASLCVVNANLQAQVDLKAATYGTDTPTAGMAPVSGVTSTLGPVTVTQVYTATAGYTFNFVSDASGVSNYLYLAAGTTPLVVGDTYTGLSLTASPFGTPANLELSVPTGTTFTPPTPSATGATGMYAAVSEASVTTTSVLADTYTAQTYTTPSDIEPVQFTFTAPTTQTVTPITGNSTITDASNSDKINFYRPTGGLSFVAGQTYLIDGYAFGYSTGTEIYDPSIVGTVVPEPSSYLMVGVGGLMLVAFARRSGWNKLA